ncbi:hypothetical protein D9M71_159880 [compost metagenome]
MLEVHGTRRPLAAQHMADQVEGHAQSQLGVLAADQDGAMAHLVVETVVLALVDQTDQAVALVQRKGAGEVDQRLLHGRRAQADVAEQAECLRLELLAVVQAEIVAAGLPRGFLQHLAVVGQRETQGRVLQQLWVDARDAEDAIGIATLLVDEGAQAAGGCSQHAGVTRAAGQLRNTGQAGRMGEQRAHGETLCRNNR